MIQHDLGVIHEGVNRRPVRPAALLLQGRGQVEVEQGGDGFNMVLLQLVQHVLVVIQPRLVNLASTVRKDSF